MPTTATLRHRHDASVSADEHVALMSDLFALLGDASRLRILVRLRTEGEACVGELAEAAHISESAVSHSLRLLKAHGVVTSRRDGRHVHYELADEHVRLLLDATLEHLERDHRR
jgi:DNA-binding transcriptional ArsR family regulator